MAKLVAVDLDPSEIVGRAAALIPQTVCRNGADLALDLRESALRVWCKVYLCEETRIDDVDIGRRDPGIDEQLLLGGYDVEDRVTRADDAPAGLEMKIDDRTADRGGDNRALKFT
jgi:hypothetical protein